jgi:16S rRNA G966 N2-methylase RsmD
VHDWYRFVLSFPPHLVRDYLTRFEVQAGQTILDPFCGTGTTVVEAKLHGLRAIGIEANTPRPFCQHGEVDRGTSMRTRLAAHASAVSAITCQRTGQLGDAPLRALADEPHALLLRDSISLLPLHKALVLLEQIRGSASSPFRDHELLALAHVLVADASNLHFGPEVGVRSIKRSDAPVVEAWLATVCQMADDIRQLPQAMPPATVHHADARNMRQLLRPASIDAVFTSPPYPNEKDYTRTTRLESVVLGYVNSKAELRAMKQGLLRSNTRNVYKLDDDDDLGCHASRGAGAGAGD